MYCWIWFPSNVEKFRGVGGVLKSKIRLEQVQETLEEELMVETLTVLRNIALEET